MESRYFLRFGHIEDKKADLIEWLFSKNSDNYIDQYNGLRIKLWVTYS